MTEDLRGEMSATFSAAKFWWRLVLVLWGCSLALAVTPHLWPGLGGGHAVAIASAVAGLLSFGARWRAEARYQTAEGLRRHLILTDALPDLPDQAEVAALRAQASAGPSSDPGPIGPYFTSGATKGRTRLLQNIEESAFYSTHLARRTAHICLAVLTLIIVGSGAVLYLGAVWDDPRTPLFADAALTAVATVVVGGLADLTRGYLSLARRADDARLKAKQVDAGRQPTESEVLQAMVSYDAALASATPIPGFVYARMRFRLDQVWSDRSKSAEPTSGVDGGPEITGSA